MDVHPTKNVSIGIDPYPNNDVVEAPFGLRLHGGPTANGRQCVQDWRRRCFENNPEVCSFEQLAWPSWRSFDGAWVNEWVAVFFEADLC